MERVDDVAAAFLASLGAMEAKKLHKLVYYAQAWSAASGRGPLFTNPIQAWEQGPVVPYLYWQHRRQWMVGKWPHGDSDELGTQAREVIAWVTDRYGHLSGAQLSALTHAEDPWLAARGDLPGDAPSQTTIKVEAMSAYYGRQILSPARAVRHAVGNAALEGLTVPVDMDETLRKVADGSRNADDVVAELVAALSATE